MFPSWSHLTSSPERRFGVLYHCQHLHRPLRGGACRAALRSLALLSWKICADSALILATDSTFSSNDIALGTWRPGNEGWKLLIAGTFFPMTLAPLSSNSISALQQLPEPDELRSLCGGGRCRHPQRLPLRVFCFTRQGEIHFWFCTKEAPWYKICVHQGSSRIRAGNSPSLPSMGSGGRPAVPSYVAGNGEKLGGMAPIAI